MAERKRPQFSHFVRPPFAKSREASGSGSSRGERERDGLPRPVYPVADPTLDEPEFLIRQNQDLRRRLEEESNNYKRRLDSYKQAQQHQAALVSRLQAKILQYKQRCADLECQIDTSGAIGDSPRHRSLSLAPLTASSAVVVSDDSKVDLDEAIRLLNDERKNSHKLSQVNDKLKQQLAEAHQTNESLTNDLQKITNEWETLREELILKEDEWRDEEHAFNEYYTAEHSRLLMLWRDVVCVKRMFAEMQMNTERDLNRFKDYCSNTARDLVRASSGLKNTAVFSAHCEEQQSLQRDNEIKELKIKIETLKGENESFVVVLKQKDDRIEELIRDLRSLGNRYAEADQNIAQMMRMEEEMEHLQGALRDIAHAVIQDAESRNSEPGQASSHVHLTPAVPVPPRSPKRGLARTPSSPAFAESTISAVQAALHKYQLQIHDCQVKLATNKDQHSNLKKQFDAACESQQNLMVQVSNLTNQLDLAKAEVSQLSQEKELLSKSLEGMKAEKSQLEKNKIELSAMLDSLNSDYDKLQKSQAKVQKMNDVLEDEKLFLQSEVDRLIKDGEMRERNLRAEEDRSSRMREELLTIREDINKAYLEKEMLQSQKVESHAILAQLEKDKSDLEMELEKVLLEKVDLQESLDKVENVGCNLQEERNRLEDEIRRLENDRENLRGQLADQQGDIMSLRKELLQAEQNRLDLDSDKVSLQEKIKFLEVEKEKVEIELGSVARERNELRNEMSALSRKREALNEETMRLKQRLEQATETNARINRTLEDLVKDNEDKQILLESSEKELQRVQEQLASLRSEKEALEAVLFDTQTNLEASDIKKLQLEKENQDLLIKQEALRGQLTRVTKDIEMLEKRCHETKAALVQQMTVQETDYQQIIGNLKKCNDDNIKKLSEEKEQMRMSLEKKLLSSVQQLNGEKERQVQQLQEKVDTLQNHVDNLCQQHEEVLLRAENEKQQALMLAHQDQQALADKLDSCQKKLDEEKAFTEKAKRESVARAEQDRVTMKNLREELGRLRTKLEEAKLNAEDDKMRLEKKIEEAKTERDSYQVESEELKMQIHILEDRNDSLQNQLHETNRRFKENENSLENAKKELTDVRRQLADSNIEKEKYLASNKELREHVKRSEGEKRETGRALEEALQRVACLEDAKSALEAEKIRLQTQSREQEKNLLQTTQKLNRIQEELGRAHSTSSTLQNEDKERQARLTSEIEERERAQQELHQLKKQIIELDGSLEIARQEMLRLRSRADEEESRWRHREQELTARLEDGRTRERKLEDQKHNLEARLGGTEGRVKALDQQLQQLEAAKKEAEQKLSSVGSTLRRIAGIQLDGSISLPFKLLSPSRRWSPARSHDHMHHVHSHGHCHGDGRDPTIDVDPEIVRKGIRTLMQQVAQIERERDDLKASLNQMKKQINEASDLQNKSDEKLSHALQNLRVLQDEKNSLEAKLGQKQAALQAQTESVNQKTQENQEMREKITSMELSLHNCSEEKSQYEEKLEKLRTSVSRLEGEKRSLQEELSRTESRATKLELHRMSLEGDLQRVQLMLQDKDLQVQKLQEKCEKQSRNLTSLEERCASLKTTIDNLNSALERASGSESDLRKEIAALQKSLLEANSNTSTSNEKLKQLQKSQTNIENERRLLVERLEANQLALTDLRRANQALQDQMQRLQTDLANNEVQRSGLEAQLRHATATWNVDQSQGNHENELMRQLEIAQSAKLEFRGKIDSLNDKVDQLECLRREERVRQLEAEKRSLERQVSRSALSRSKSFERQEKGAGFQGDSPFQSRLEQENRELRAKIRYLEAQLAEKEAELARLKSQKGIDILTERPGDVERTRASVQLQSERLLEAREQSHRQQVLRLENQIQLLREQLNQEVKRRQMYVLRSSRAGREMQQLRQALGDSLRTVAQDPALDPVLLEQETRKLDTTVSSTAPVLSLPPASYEYSSSQ
ncbi:hypothetical protein RUM44_008923 [Polyplax serrata]|uniref:Rootletin-like coiled-coil domain-containing protein n=1 Tax=Polyplax serrata TaxID=468196 RepID=A0ABR1ARA8_POLSC